MGEIVNLRGARKQKARRAAEKAADANRVAFGLPKADRRISELEKALAGRHLDGHAFEPSNPDKSDE